MKIIWQAEDGYAGGSRPHHLTIPDDELEGKTEDELDEIIEEYVRDAFEQRVSYSWRRA